MKRNRNRKLLFVGSRMIGYIEERVFYKKVVGSIHKLQNPEAWCVDVDIFEKTIINDADTIVVYDTEKRKEYRASVDNFLRFKGSIDRGFGAQYFLTLDKWLIRNAGQGALI